MATAAGWAGLICQANVDSSYLVGVGEILRGGYCSVVNGVRDGHQMSPCGALGVEVHSGVKQRPRMVHLNLQDLRAVRPRLVHYPAGGEAP